MPARPIRPGPHPTPVPHTAENLRELLDRNEYEAVQPFPGGDADWHVRCRLCRAEVFVVASALRAADKGRTGGRRARCNHPTRRTITPPPARVTRQES